MQFVLTRMRNSDGGLLHRYRDGEPAIPAYGDDYAFIIKALLELYESTFELSYLSSARELNTFFLAHFWDDAQGGFFMISDTAEILLGRKKEIYDGAIPSCNSVAFENLVRLAHLTGDVSNEQRASELSRCFAESVHQYPSAHTWFLCALDSAIGPIHDIVIVGRRDGEDTRAMIKLLRDQYLPGIMIVCKSPEDDLRISSLPPFTRNLHAIGGNATAYICTGQSCILPVTEPHRVLELLSCVKTGK
jgi:hypothetical protein